MYEAHEQVLCYSSERSAAVLPAPQAVPPASTAAYLGDITITSFLVTVLMTLQEVHKVSNWYLGTVVASLSLDSIELRHLGIILGLPHSDLLVTLLWKGPG